MRTKRIAFELSEELYNQIKTYAHDRQMNISTAMRQALIEFAEVHKLPTLAPTNPRAAERPRELSRTKPSAEDLEELDRQAREAWLSENQ